MSSSNASQTPALPLFYNRIEMLNFSEHGGFGVRNTAADALNFGYARGAIAVPVTLGELAIAARHFPVIFAADATAMPLAVLGLEAGKNLFVDKNGHWRPGTYVPAYVRRYPFITVNGPEGRQLLGADTSSPRISSRPGEGIVPLFDSAGGPTELARGILNFCETFAREYAQTQAFVADLNARGLLVDRSADLRFPDGTPHRVDGFRVVDENALRALPDDVVVDWHKRGLLALITLHLSSQVGWQPLVDLAVSQRRPN